MRLSSKLIQNLEVQLNIEQIQLHNKLTVDQGGCFGP